jgi:hypothetical protein
MTILPQNIPVFCRARAFKMRASVRIGLLIWIVSISAAALFIFRTASVPRPVKFAVAGAPPVRPMFQSGSWYWLEKPKGPQARLVKMAGGPVETIDSADEITGFDASATSAVWACLTGRQWSVKTAANGAQTKVLWTGTDPAKSVRIDGDYAYILVSLASPVARALPFPPLGKKLSLLRVPLAGGTGVSVATLMEDEGEIYGVHGHEVFISAWRNGPPGSTAFYTVNQEGKAKRLAGEAGKTNAIITRDGTSYWMGNSRESFYETGISAIIRMGKSGKPELVSDWYPTDGQLFETSRGVYYVDGDVRRQIWPVAEPGQMPKPLPYSIYFSALAVNDTEAIFQPISYTPRAVVLSRSPLK